MSIPTSAPPIKIPEAFRKDPEVLAFFTSLLSSNYQKWSEIRQGDFTPTIQDSLLSDSKSQTYSSQVGYYYRIGDMCYLSGHLIITSFGTLTTGDMARLANFPFPAHNKVDIFGHINLTFASGLAIPANSSITGHIKQASNHCAMQLWDATTGTSNLLLSELTASANIYFDGWYIAE